MERMMIHTTFHSTHNALFAKISVKWSERAGHRSVVDKSIFEHRQVRIPLSRVSIATLARRIQRKLQVENILCLGVSILSFLQIVTLNLFLAIAAALFSGDFGLVRSWFSNSRSVAGWSFFRGNGDAGRR